MEEEIWKDVVGYEGLYKVSSFGRVKSLEKYRKSAGGGKILHKEKILKLGTNHFGYKYIILCNDEGKRLFLVHRLMGISFLANPFNLPQINHINAIKDSNFIWNIEWVTSQQNTDHAKSMGLLRASMSGIFGKDHNRSRVVYQYDLNGYFIKKFYCIKDAASELNMDSISICRCCSGKLKTTKGFTFRYFKRKKIALFLKCLNKP